VVQSYNWQTYGFRNRSNLRPGRQVYRHTGSGPIWCNQGQRLLHKLEVEQIQTEKLEELDKLKSRFFENISHEFRTPLTLILGPIEKLRLYLKDKEPTENLNMMQRNAVRLQNLINQLLNLSRLESGKMKLQASQVNIVDLVNGYVQSFESLAKQKKINLTFKSNEKNINLFVDKDKIEKILYNLLSNAFKFTGEEGKIEVIVTPLNPLPKQVRDRLLRGETYRTLVSNQPCVEIKRRPPTEFRLSKPDRFVKAMLLERYDHPVIELTLISPDKLVNASLFSMLKFPKIV